MLRDDVYDGLTCFSAAQVSGLLLHPVIGWGGASTQARDLYFNPQLPPDEQRGEFIHQIALRRAAGPEGGTVADYERDLDDKLLKC